MGLAEGLFAGCADGVTSTAVNLALDGASLYQQGGVAAACAEADWGTCIYYGCKTLGRIAGATYSCTPQGKAIQAAISGASTAMPLAKGTSNVLQATKAANNVRTMAKVGRTGENVVNTANGWTKNSKTIASAIHAKKNRIPDVMNPFEKFMVETKNVAKLSLTKQIRDYIAIAKREGWKFYLYLRPDTKMSKPLQEAIELNQIIRQDIPW